jgi:hypothetical protein
MTNPSPISEVLFIALVLAVLAMFAYAVGKTARGTKQPGRGQWGVASLVVIFWLALPAVLAGRGALDRYSPLPAPALVLAGLLTAGTVILAVSGFGARFATNLPLAGLVGYQAFRVPVEWLLHRLHAEGVVPVQMTYSGRNFDVVSGLTAAALGLWLLKARRPAAWLVTAWNVLGFCLLANIVTIAVLSTPAPFRVFTNDPPNLLPSTFPYVWLPTFLVPAALFGHLVVWRALRRGPG